MDKPHLTNKLDATQLQAMSDEELMRLGLGVSEIQTLKSLPTTQLSSMIPLVIAAGKEKAAAIADTLAFIPEIDVNGNRRCVYVNRNGVRCEHYGDKNIPVCKAHRKHAASLGTYFQSSKLRDTFAAFATSGEKLRADGELALMRTMLATLLSKIDDDNANIEVIASVTAMCDKITQVVERISKIEKLTPEHMERMMKAIVELAAAYIPADKLEEFAGKVEAINVDKDAITADGNFMPGDVVDGKVIEAEQAEVIVEPPDLTVKKALLETAQRFGLVPNNDTDKSS